MAQTGSHTSWEQNLHAMPAMRPRDTSTEIDLDGEILTDGEINFSAMMPRKRRRDDSPDRYAYDENDSSPMDIDFDARLAIKDHTINELTNRLRSFQIKLQRLESSQDPRRVHTWSGPQPGTCKILALPLELALSIIYRCDQGTLNALSRTCTALSDLATDALFLRPRFPPFDNGNFLRATLDVDDRYLTNMRYLTVPETTECDWLRWLNRRMLRGSASKCLRPFRLSRLHTLHVIPDPSNEDIIPLSSILPKIFPLGCGGALRTLHLQAVLGTERVYNLDPLHSLDVLKIDSIVDSTPTTIQSIARAFPTLYTLSIADTRFHQSDHDALGEFSFLRTLKLTAFPWSRTVPIVLPPFIPRIENLDLHFRGEERQGVGANFAFPLLNLRTLRFFFRGQASVNAFLEALDNFSYPLLRSVAIQGTDFGGIRNGGIELSGVRERLEAAGFEEVSERLWVLPAKQGRRGGLVPGGVQAAQGKKAMNPGDVAMDDSE